MFSKKLTMKSTMSYSAKIIALKQLYDDLFHMFNDKNYFIITTNADHMLLHAGFDKHRLFYVQGDYGLLQCSVPCSQKTYENEDMIRQMIARQDGLSIPTELLPTCPNCNAPLTLNLRMDDKFAQDTGWYKALDRYEAFLKTNSNSKVLYLELGVGNNTPSIIKWPFWNYTNANKNAYYTCISYNDAYAPDNISKRSICLLEDIKKVLDDVKKCTSKWKC